MLKLTAIVVLILSSMGPLFGQADANKGQIGGTVYDPNQAVVPNADVTIRNADTGLERTLKTNASGQYRAVLLDAGRYQILAKASGFAEAKVEGVQLNVGSSIAVDIVLQVQATTTVVEVGASLLNVALPAPSTTIGLSAISNLPINGRRFQDFAVLTPTVQVDPSRGQLSFAGQRGINANVMLDGGDYNQPFFGGIRGGERSNSIITVPQSAIQEFQVITTGYSAEYGRSTGGILNTITKSGSNQLHGDAFYQIRHKEMGSKDPVQLIASLETLQQYGGSAGGPVKKDKLFLFGAFEGQQSSQPRRVFFAQLLNRAASPATAEALNFFRSQERPFTQTNDATAFTVRGDYQSEKGHRLTLRYNFSDASAGNAVSVGGALDPFTNRAFSNDGVEKDRTHTGTAQWTHLISPAALNDFRFTGSYELRPRLANSALPQVTATPIGIFGARNFLPTTQNDRRIQISDALSITRGSHILKFGFDYSRVTAAQIFGFNQFGAFNIASSNVEDILRILSVSPGRNRFDDPAVTYNRQIGNLTAEMGMTQAAVFAQDSWRVGQKLTIDLGIRWEGQYNPAVEANNTDVINLVRNTRLPNNVQLDPTFIPDATKQFAPRFGFAYTPLTTHHRTVIRGHAGLFYASTPLLWFAGPANNFRIPPGDVSILLAPTGGRTVYQQLLAAGVDLNRTPLDQLPVIPIETVQRAASLALGAPPNPFNGASLIAVANDFENPRAFQTGIGFDTELTRAWIVGAQFNLVNTVHLGRNVDYNLPLPFIRANDASQRPTFGLRTGTTRPIRSLGSITARSSSARSMFRSTTLSSQYRGKRLQSGVHYTWAQNYSDDDNERDATGFTYANPFDFKADYGFSRLDIRHQLAAYAVISLPLGFETGLSVRARSGQVVNPVTGADTNEEFSNNDRPFSAPGRPLARNSFRNRKVINNDLRVLKNFPFGGDSKRIQFSVEFFNLLNLNNVVFSGPNGSIITGGVYGLGIGTNGQPVAVDPRFLRLRNPDGTYDRNNTQSGTPLQVQFGLRFFF